MTEMATGQDRLQKIAQMHVVEQGAGGTVSGDCNECGWSWPCPTYRWATDGTATSLCSWDLDECSFEEHDHAEVKS